MALETLLAASHWDNVATRDAIKTYNAHTHRRARWRSRPSSLGTLGCPGLEAPAGRSSKSSCASRASSSGLGGCARRRSTSTTGARGSTWHVVCSEFAPLLPQSFVDEDFDFHGRTLSGQPENRERWKRGVSLVEACVGEAVGQLYAERCFPPAAKERMQELVGNLVEAFRRSFDWLEWMGPQTRAQALDKLDVVHAEDRLPRRWRDYSSLEIDPTTSSATCGAPTVRARPPPRQARAARSTATSG